MGRDRIGRASLEEKALCEIHLSHSEIKKKGTRVKNWGRTTPFENSFDVVRGRLQMMSLLPIHHITPQKFRIQGVHNFFYNEITLQQKPFNYLNQQVNQILNLFACIWTMATSTFKLAVLSTAASGLKVSKNYLV